MKKTKILTTKNMVLIGMLAALSAVIMVFQFPVPFAPPFYQIDFAEVPILISAFAIHPLAGVITEFIKILIKLLISGTNTYFVGELSNFICGVAFVLPCAMIYHHEKTKKHAAVGLCISTVSLSIVAGLSNLFLILPVYAYTMGLNIQDFVAMGTEANGFVSSLPTFILFAVVPFNLLKGALNAIITFLLYKHVARFIKSHNS